MVTPSVAPKRGQPPGMGGPGGWFGEGQSGLLFAGLTGAPEEPTVGGVAGNGFGGGAEGREELVAALDGPSSGPVWGANTPSAPGR